MVLLAAGEGKRVGSDTNKVLVPLAGKPVFTWSLRAIQDLEFVDQVVVVIQEQDRDVFERTLGEHFPGLDVTLVPGGSTRHGSEWNALNALRPLIEGNEVDVVAIHDAARPLASSALFEEVIQTAWVHGGALPVVEQSALVPRDSGSPRMDRAVAVQTPQAFRAGRLLFAYSSAEADGFVGTDTASCLERYTRTEIHCVQSDVNNLKITFVEDVALAEQLMVKLAQIR